MAREKWYAVQEDRMDAWDNGSYDYAEAVRMLEKQGHGLIAVINEDSGLCEEEIEYEDIAEDSEDAETWIREIEGEMPLDRWDGDHYIHATGREYWDDFPGCWRTEYEDDQTVDQTTNWKRYRDFDTGEVWTTPEIKEAYEEVKDELGLGTFEEYLEEQLAKGRNRCGGLVEED